MNAIDIDPNEESNRQEGGSRPKGKEADPRNWGGVQLMGREMDHEVQRRLLDSYIVKLERNDDQEEGNQHEEKQNYEETLETDDKERLRNRRMVGALLQASREIVERERRRAKKKGREYIVPREFEENTQYLLEQLNATEQEDPGEREEDLPSPKRKRKRKSRSKKKATRTEAMKPVAQISDESALGHAFQRIGDMNDSDPSDDGSESSSEENSEGSYSTDSDSEGSPTSGGSSSDSSSDSSQEGCQGRGRRMRSSSRRNRKKDRKRKDSRKCRKTRRSRSGSDCIRPNPPSSHDGSADVQQFMQFMSNWSSSSKYKSHGGSKPKEDTGPSKYRGGHKKLSQEDEDEYRAGNKCFVCGRMGHFARNCYQNKTVRSDNSQPPGIQSSSVRLDLQEIDRQIEEARGDTTQGLSIGMIGMEASADSESDPEYLSGEETVWDIISLDFVDEEEGEELVTYDDLPALQPISDSDESKCDSLPDLQSVSDSEESNASISCEEEQPNETPESETEEAEDEVSEDQSEQEDSIITSPPEEFGSDVYSEKVPNGEVRTRGPSAGMASPDSIVLPAC
ncbi:hypothetical protein C0993_001356 [Termitomyces sp. T159_Od127]|nr:hypothetical protein C0993_001356 [Termitomyces sp. T159_Od127]